MQPSLRALFLVFIPFVGMAFADTVVLKDGSRINGEIIEDGSNGVTVEYFATPTIKDQRTVAKDDIDGIERLAPDKKAFQELGSLTPPPTVKDTSFYDPLVDQKLPEFLAKYPDSLLNADAWERLKALSEERDRVRKGDLRLDSVWICASEIAAEPYQTGALIKFTDLKEAASSNNAVAALRFYELLEKNYPGAAVMPDAVTIALQQLQQLQSQLTVAKANCEIELKNISNAVASLEKTRADEAKNMKDVLLRYENNAKAAMAVAAADGSKFFPVFQKSKESLATLQALVVSERARLAQFPIDTMRDGIAAAKQGFSLIKEGKLKEAQEQLALSQRLWPANVDNPKLKEQVDQLATDQANQSGGKKQPSTQTLKP